MHFQRQESLKHDMVMMLTNVRGKFENLASDAHGFLLELLQNKLVGFCPPSMNLSRYSPCYPHDHTIVCSIQKELLGSLQFVNWKLDRIPKAPNENVIELTEYLTVTFQRLTNLPQSVRGEMTSCFPFLHHSDKINYLFFARKVITIQCSKSYGLCIDFSFSFRLSTFYVLRSREGWLHILHVGRLETR